MCSAASRHRRSGSRAKFLLPLESGVAGLRSSPLIRAGTQLPPYRLHHKAYDTGRLESLPYLEPRWRTEIAHAVLHMGLIGAYRRLGRVSH